MGKKKKTNQEVIGNMKHCYENLNHPWDLPAFRDRTEAVGRLRAYSSFPSCCKITYALHIFNSSKLDIDMLIYILLYAECN